MILAVKTASFEAAIQLLDRGEVKADQAWTPGRKLSVELLPAIEHLLKRLGKHWRDLNGIIVFRGPGSFTSLRIGHTVANAMAYGLDIPVVAAGGEDWIKTGEHELKSNHFEQIAVPEYGSEPNIGVAKK